MGCISMFGNHKKNKVKVILPDNARCDKCGRRIRKGDTFLYMDDKLYYYDGNAKTYYVMNQGAKGDDTNDAYAPAESYKKTKEKKK